MRNKITFWLARMKALIAKIEMAAQNTLAIINRLKTFASQLKTSIKQEK